MGDRNRLTLEVAVVTFGPDGGRRIEAMGLPELSGVSYLVSWQERNGLPLPDSVAARKDITVMEMHGLGSSRNRNNCLDHATGDIILFADDDLKLYPEGLLGVLKAFEDNSGLEYGSFRYNNEGGLAKSYPSEECPLHNLPKNFYQTTFEIALRRNSRAGRLRFCEDFGFAVKEFTAGEDELMLMRARRQRLDCRFFPVTVAFHSGATTGVRPRLADGMILTQGALIIAGYPLTSWLRIPLVSWRIARKGQAKFSHALRMMLLGAYKELTGGPARRYINAPL